MIMGLARLRRANPVIMPGRRRPGPRPLSAGPAACCSAVVIRRSISSRNENPLAAHILGKYDAAVIPGMVLISLSRISPSGV